MAPPVTRSAAMTFRMTAVIFRMNRTYEHTPDDES